LPTSEVPLCQSARYHGLVAATSSYVRRRSLDIAITVFSMSMR